MVQELISCRLYVHHSQKKKKKQRERCAKKKSIQFSSFPRVALDSFHVIIKLAMICNFLNGFFYGTWITELKKKI